MNSRIKAMAKMAEPKGNRQGGKGVDHSTSSRAPPRAPAPKIMVKASERPSSAAPAAKKRASTPPSPTPPKRLTAAEKGKGIESTSLPILLELPREERDAVFEPPRFGNPRLPEIPNSHSILEGAAEEASWKVFQAVLFDQDQKILSNERPSTLLRTMASYLSVVSNMAFNLSHRSVLTSRENRELREEKRQLEKEVASSSKEKVKDLQGQITTMRARISDLEKDNKGSLQLIEQLQSDAFEARQKGEEHGRNSSFAEKDEEFRRSMPQIRLQAVRDFVHSPVFNAANVWLGSNDLMAGWNRAIGQAKTLGAQFEEGMLDILLDEDLQPMEDDEEEIDLNFRGHEFESVMDDVRELQRKFEEKHAAAEEKRKKKKAASPPPAHPVDGAEMIEALQTDAQDDAIEADIEKGEEPLLSHAP